MFGDGGHGDNTTTITTTNNPLSLPVPYHNLGLQYQYQRTNLHMPRQTLLFSKVELISASDPQRYMIMKARPYILTLYMFVLILLIGGM
jgi:hypothetical protein